MAAFVVVLGMVGAGVGWALHGIGSARVSASAPPSAGEPVPPSPVASGATPVARLAPLALPDVTGSDFVVARQRLRDLQLGVQLVFAKQGDARTVAQTVPAPGSPVDRGTTVKVYVSGVAPVLMPPDVVGRSCNEAGRSLADAGLYPQYPNGRHGTVTAQDPPGNAAGVHWNDQVKLACTAGPSGSA